jgi:hypothetical protein
VKGHFDFRVTRNGIRIVTKDVADFSTNRSHFESSNLPYFTVSPKLQKHITAVILDLQFTTPAEGISDGLVDLRFDVFMVKQMSATYSKPSPLPHTLT